MHTPVEEPELTAEEVVELSRRYTVFDWSVQATIDPLPIDHAEGVHFWTTDGRRFLDFNSQLWSVNLGHADPRVIAAVERQLERLPYVSPFMATEIRARLGRKLVERLPGDLDKVFFTLGGAEANEHAVKIARLVTGRHKVLARYRSYHGATIGAISLTGDPRRWAAEPGLVGVVRAPDFHRWAERDPLSAEVALRELEDVIMYEGGHTIAAFILEPVVGTNGVLIPPDGYLQGVREICDRHGIVLIADEVMSGFGRTGRWFAVEHWGIVPDLITMAKGLTSSTIPLGAVGLRRWIADHFERRVFDSGLTYNSHPVALAAALATIEAYEEDGLIERAARMGELMGRYLARLAARHRCVGAVRNIGLFGIIDLVRRHDPYTPIAPYNGTSDEMAAIGRHLRTHGLYTVTRWNSIMTSPPLIITDDELAEGFATTDDALSIADAAVLD